MKLITKVEDDFEKSRPISLVLSSTCTAKKGEAFARPHWNCWSFEYITEGYGTYEIGGKKHRLGPGDMYVLPKGLAHHYYADREDPWSKIFFGVAGRGVDSLLRDYELHATYFYPDCECLELFQNINDGVKNKNTPTHDHVALKFHEMLIKLSNKVSRVKDSYSPSIRKTIEFLNNSVEIPVSMNDISKEAGKSSSHLSRKFRDEVGISPYEYLINLRMHLACRLLKMTSITIKQISETLCYADAYYFSNAFKKHSGVSPQQFRKENKDLE